MVDIQLERFKMVLNVQYVTVDEKYQHTSKESGHRFQRAPPSGRRARSVLIVELGANKVTIRVMVECGKTGKGERKAGSRKTFGKLGVNYTSSGQ